jgi:hypothetical protein
MPSYQVTAPDGRKYRVNAPEGATQEQALQYVQQNYQTASRGAGSAAPTVKRVQYPDGSVHRIEVPEGATDEQTIAFAQQDYQQRSGGQSLAQLKASSPAYAGLSDEDFGQRVYQKYYAGQMPYDEFQQRTQADSSPIRVPLPDGNTAEFPAGTSSDVVQAAVQRYQTGHPIRMNLPDGNVAEFPAGTSQQVIDGAVQRYQSKQGAHDGNTRLQQIEQALRAADAAGNTDDARRLAQAYAAERDSSQAPAYSEDQLFAKLEKADAAGDTEAAHVIADEIRRIRGQQGNGPQQASRTAPARANFGNVRGNATTVPGRRDTYTGPLLAPSTMAGTASQAPTLADTNASNRAYQASPQAAIDRQRYTASQAEAKRRDFQSLPAAARFAIGAGSRVAAAGRGVGQVYAAAADAVDPRAPTLGGLVTGQDSFRYGQAMQGEAAARAGQQYLRGDTAATLGGFAGDLGLLAAPGGAVGRTRGLAALLGNAGLGAGYAGLQPVVQGESRAANAVVGGAFGAAGHGVASGVSALGRNASQAIPTEVRQMAQRANAMGIPLHASQVSQSLPVKVAASAGKYLPFSGYGKAASRQQEGVNRAVAKTFGADAPKLTDDVMQQARKRLSREFESIYNRNAVPITEKGARKLAEVEREASRRLTNDEAQVLRNQLDDILGNADDGVLTGQKYQAVRTALRKAEGND